MKTIIKSIALVAIIFVSACAKPEYSDASISQSKILNKQQAMLVTKLSVPYKDLYGRHGSYAGYMIIQNLDNYAYKYYIDGTSYISSASMIIPGNYSITIIGWSDGAFNYPVPMDGTIEVKPGDCIYLGDISVLNQDNRVTLKFTNNLKNVIKELNENEYTQLTKRIKYYY